jgi:hypothetical protein
MALDPRLENYLATLHRALLSLPLSDRADIVMELKSHVLASLEKNPDGSLDDILQSLGEPEQVASRYLLERGLAPMKPPISPIVKWLVIGFLGTLGFILFGLIMMIYALSPLISVNEKEGKVSILGGWISVDEKAGTFRMGSNRGERSFGEEKILGSEKVVPTQKIVIDFGNGKIRLINSANTDLTWECQMRHSRESSTPIAVSTKEEVQVVLDDPAIESCIVSIPNEQSVALEAEVGMVEVQEPLFSLQADLDVGRIKVQPKDGTAYSIIGKVGIGKVSPPRNDPNPKFSLSLEVDTGSIEIKD